MKLEKNVPVMFSPIEAAKILSVSRSQVYVLLREGQLKSLKLGRSRRISENQMIAFIQKLEQENALDI
jgi:excisionase family DNA binding protein